MILAQWDARGAAHTSPKSRHPHAPRSLLGRLLRSLRTSPERPRRGIAKPEEVGTGSRPLGITKDIMGDDLVAIARMASRAVGM